MNKTLALVYQAGIANVFDLSNGKRERILQTSFDVAETFVRGALFCGARVHIRACCRAGDISRENWDTPLSIAPFDVAVPKVRLEIAYHKNCAHVNKKDFEKLS